MIFACLGSETKYYYLKRENEEKVELVRNVVDKVKNLIEGVKMHCSPLPFLLI